MGSEEKEEAVAGKGAHQTYLYLGTTHMAFCPRRPAAAVNVLEHRKNIYMSIAALIHDLNTRSKCSGLRLISV